MRAPLSVEAQISGSPLADYWGLSVVEVLDLNFVDWTGPCQLESDASAQEWRNNSHSLVSQIWAKCVTVFSTRGRPRPKLHQPERPFPAPLRRFNDRHSTSIFTFLSSHLLPVSFLLDSAGLHFDLPVPRMLPGFASSLPRSDPDLNFSFQGASRT